MWAGIVNIGAGSGGFDFGSIADIGGGAGGFDVSGLGDWANVGGGDVLGDFLTANNNFAGVGGGFGSWLSDNAGGIVRGLGPLVGGALSQNNANATRNAANQQSAQATMLAQQRQVQVDAAVARMNALTPPNLLEYIKPYQRQVLQGILTPEDAVAQMQEATRMAGIQVPQSLLDAQTNALTQIQQIASEGGMTAIDKAQLDEIQQRQAARTAGEQGAIINDAQQRGVAGSGMEMAARLVSQQGAANGASMAGTQVAADAQRRALEAMKTSGTMASGMRDQSWNEQAAAAKAQDEINRFNSALTSTTNASNTAARNAAQATNLAAAQQVANNNAEIARAEEAAKYAAAQQMWQNTYGQARDAANTQAGLANVATGQVNQANSLANTQNQQANATQGAALQQFGNGAQAIADLFTKKKQEY